MTEYVTVCSKLPMSLNCQLQTESVVTMRNGPNTWTEPCWKYTGVAYTIRGANVPAGQPPARYRFPRLVADNSAALTRIPRDHALAWFEQQKDADFIKNKLVFIVGHKDEAGEAKELKSIRSGFDPLTPIAHDSNGNQISGDSRWPKRRTAAAFLGAGDPDLNNEPTE
jgi:hypothetical protein